MDYPSHLTVAQTVRALEADTGKKFNRKWVEHNLPSIRVHGTVMVPVSSWKG